MTKIPVVGSVGGPDLEFTPAQKTLDEYFRDWEGHVFGFGYGTGEEFTLGALLAFFSLLKDGRTYDYKDLENGMTPPVAWLMINILCRADVVEYGTSPRFGWLTRKGERLRDYLAGKTLDQVLEVIPADQEYAHCYPDACNCGPDGYEAGRVCQNPFWT